MNTSLASFFQHEALPLCAETLDFWLHEASLDEAPSESEVAQWQAIFQARGGKFQRLAQSCSQWLAEHQPPAAP